MGASAAAGVALAARACPAAAARMITGCSSWLSGLAGGNHSRPMAASLTAASRAKACASLVRRTPVAEGGRFVECVLLFALFFLPMLFRLFVPQFLQEVAVL